MKKILLTIMFLLGLGFLIITTPLINFFIDKELDNGDSVRALAKDIASNASCDLDVFGGLIETSSQDTLHQFMCDHRRKNVHFLINIFTTQKAKNKFLEEDTKRKHYFQEHFKSYYNAKHDRNLTRGCPDFYNPCFKQGGYYVVCENADWNQYTGVPHFNGEPYYHEFKGEDIEWRIPSQVKGY